MSAIFGRRRIRNRKKPKVTASKIRKWDKTSKIVRAGELKFYNQNVQSTVNSATIATIANLTNMAQGLTGSTREGDSINPVSISVKGYYTFNDDTIDEQTIRILLIKDTQQAGAEPVTASNISVPLGVLNDPDVNSVMNVTGTKKRFVVLHDIRLTITRTLESRKMFSFKSKLSGKIEYNGAGAAEVNMMKNQIYIFMLVDVPGTTLASKVDWYSNLMYRDS